MSPTEDKSILYKRNDTNEPHLGEFIINDPDDKLRTNQHLYFTSGEEIKEGGKMLTHEGVETAEYDGYSFDNGDEFCLKIIASTDPKLNLPQPTQAFIKAYCEQGGIDEVDVEYEEFYAFCVGDTVTVKSERELFGVEKGQKLIVKAFEGDHIRYEGDGVQGIHSSHLEEGFDSVFTLKIDPIHNTITTHRIVEKTYSRDDIIHALTYGHRMGKQGESHANTLIEFKKDHIEAMLPQQ